MSDLKKNLVTVYLILMGITFLFSGKILGENNSKSVNGKSKNGKAVLGQLNEEIQNGSSYKLNPSISTSPIIKKKLNEIISLTGSLEADEKSDVSSNVSGILSSINCERGDVIEKGFIIARLDSKDAENALDLGEAQLESLRVRLGIKNSKDEFIIEKQPEVAAAKSSLDLAESDFKRYSELLNSKTISQSEFDKKDTEYKTAKNRYDQTLYQTAQLYQSYLAENARIKILKKAVQDTIIKAPFSGIVAEKYVSSGERVSPGGPGNGGKIINLVKVNPLRLLITVSQQYVAYIKEGQTVNFKVEGFSGREFSGKVRYIGPSLESSSRSLIVEAVVENKDRILRPGLFATAQLILEKENEGLFVPVSALKKEIDIVKIFKVEKGYIKESVVETGAYEKDLVRIISGINENDIVVLNPDKILDGDKIN